MNLKRVLEIYEIIKDRLPSTYPRPKLAFFEDEENMLLNQNIKMKKDEVVHAVVNPNTFTINLPMKLTFTYWNSKGNSVDRVTPINKMSDYDIAHTILHEIGHLYAGDRYGYSSEQFSDESYCDRFAERWIKVLKKDKLL